MTILVRPCALSLALLLLPLGCRDEQAGPAPRRSSRAIPAQPPLRVLDAPPSELTFHSGGTFADGAIEYLGSLVLPASPRPGQPLRLAHYFRARRAVAPGFHFFVHLLDAQSGAFLGNVDHEFQGGQLPLGTWPLGKVVEDVHGVTVPPGVGPVRVVLGFWKDEERLRVDQAPAQAGENRMLGPLLSFPAEALPEYRVKRTATPPKIDGELGDPVWARATPVTLRSSMDGSPTTLKTVARLLYDDSNLYVSFDCEDPDVWGTLKNRDDPIYNEEVVEIFLDANADGRTYNELEVSPHNVVFDAYFPARRQGMDLSFDSRIVSAVKVQGTLDNDSDRDKGWTVEMQIPFAPLAEVPHLPPRPGDRFRFNLYRLEHLGRRQVEGQAFSPLFIGDFHNLPRFGWLTFE